MEAARFFSTIEQDKDAARPRFMQLQTDDGANLRHLAWVSKFAKAAELNPVADLELMHLTVQGVCPDILCQAAERRQAKCLSIAKSFADRRAIASEGEAAHGIWIIRPIRQRKPAALQWFQTEPPLGIGNRLTRVSSSAPNGQGAENAQFRFQIADCQNRYGLYHG